MNTHRTRAARSRAVLVSLLRPRDLIVDVRYFTAAVLDDPDAARRQQTQPGKGRG